MPSYCYAGYDLKHPQGFVAGDSAIGVVGVADWELAIASDRP